MSFKSFQNKSKFFYAIQVIFILWIIALVGFAILGLRNVDFFDYLNRDYVTSDYSIDIPVIRYIFEPIIGITYNFTIMDYYFPLLLIGGYLLYRIIYLIAKKTERIHSEKFKLLMHSFREFFKFVAMVGLIAVAFVVSYYLIGLLTVGTFIKYSIIGTIEIVALVSGIIILAKLGYILYKFYHPHLQFNIQKKLRERKQYNKYLSKTGRELGYFFCFVFLLLVGTIILKTTKFPLSQIETEKNEGEILLDFHAHTTFSDGWLSPEERVRWYIDQGIDVAAITDHQTTAGAKKAKEFVEANNLPLKIIIGQEYTTSYGIHLNIYGIEEDIVPIEFKDETDDLALTTENMIKYVKKNGGYVIVNHYNARENENGGLGAPYNYTQLKEWGVDGFEIINSGNLYPPEIKRFCLENDLICVATTDVHQNVDITGFMKIKLDDPDDVNVDSIFDSLQENEHESVQIRRYDKIVNFQDPLENFEEIENFMNYILQLDTFQYVSWILWSILGYLFVHYSYVKIRNFDLELLKKKML